MIVHRGVRAPLVLLTLLAVALATSAHLAEPSGAERTTGGDLSEPSGTDRTTSGDLAEPSGAERTDHGDLAEASGTERAGSADGDPESAAGTSPAPPGSWHCPSGCYCADGLEWTAECWRAELAYSAAWQPAEYVKLTCVAPAARRLRPTELPALLAAQFVDSSGLYECALAAGAGVWAAALRALGVSGTARLTLHAAHQDTLTGAALRGLGALDTLTVREPVGAGPWTPPRDLLAATPALRRFTVRGAFVRLEAAGLAAAPASLHTLELAEGRVELVRGAFRGLTHVRRLLLWRAGLEALEPGTLDGLDELEELELTGNALTALEAGALGGSPRLRVLHVAGNPVARVEPGALPLALSALELWRCAGSSRLELGAALAGLAALRAARLEHCRLGRVSAGLLAGAGALQNLSLAGAGLQALPMGLFSDARLLERLDLSHNDLDHLPAGIFANLSSLQELNLNWNRIQSLSEGSLSGLSSLLVLHAGSCGLRSLRLGALEHAPRLTHLQLDNNSLTLDEDSAPDDTFGPHSALRVLRSLSSVLLAHNAVSRVFADWRLSPHLSHLDLSHNRLQLLSDADLNFLSSNILVDLRNNNISTVRLVNLPPPPAEREARGEGGEGGGGGGASILLDDNPYVCDCLLEGFVRRVQAGGAGVRARHALCRAPPTLAGRALRAVAPRDLTCALDAAPAGPCPTECECVARTAAAALELTCARVPDTLPAPHTLGLGHTALRVRTAPAAGTARTLPPHVTLLDVSRLNLSAAPALWLSRGATLDLRHNALRAPPESLLRAADASGFTVLLAGNPMRCPCDPDARRLLNDTVGDWGSVSCEVCAGAGGAGAGAGTLLGGALALCACVVVACAALAALAAVAARYRRAARAFLVARGLWAARAPADDKAQYDAFVSYSHADDEWVSALARRLEAGGARLCLHARDWAPGDWIPAQIERSVRAARRTLLVVSGAWAASSWARAEWAAAHAREVREGRARVLVVLLGGGGVPPGLPASLRAHLAARTYLPHDDPRLHDKLLAALRAPVQRARAPPVPPPVPPLGPDKLDARY